MNKTILVVEWDRTYQQIVKRGLGDEGYRVILAGNGKEAVSLFRAERPDAVILSLKLPQMDGIEVMYKIMDIKQDTPIIINSAYTRFRDNYLCWAANAFVKKSPDLRELLETLNQLLCTEKCQTGG